MGRALAASILTGVVALLSSSGQAAHAPADGALVAEAPCVVSSPTYDSYLAVLKGRVSADPKDTGFDEAAFRRNTPEAWFRALKGSDGVRCRRITYGSDGLRVTGFIVEPSTPGRHRTVIFNRGGTQDFGAIRTADLVEFAGWALDGYVVAASQYRGNDGGEGREEWGGADVHDIVNLAVLARALPSVEPEALYMHGVSRGGMMTYRALAAGLRVRAAATVGAPADLAMGLTHRPEMEEVYRDLMPGDATRALARALRRGAAVSRHDLPGDARSLARLRPGDQLAGSPGYTIHGVMPEGFNFPSHSDLFRSCGIAANPRYYQDRAVRDRFVLVRLRPGIGVAAAGPLTVLSGRGCVTLRAWSRTSTSI